MNRIFSILSALSILMILISGGGTYWMSQTDINHAKIKSAEAMAKGISIGVSSQLSTLQKTVSKMAATDEVIHAIEASNPELQAQVAARLEQVLPNVLKIRLLAANVKELDTSNIPHMGNADLIMAQETLIKAQLPTIQGQGTHRHLAITAVIKKESTAIGIVLASLKYDFLQSTLKQTKFDSGFINLKQGNISLASTGDKSNITGTENKIVVPRSSWNIYYWPSISANNDSITMIAGTVLILALLTGLIFFIFYRKVSQTLKQDQGSILKVVKDLMGGKHVGSYPVNFAEMKAIISTIVQFKRVLDSDGKALSSEENSEIDDFFDEPTGISFLDIDQGIDMESSSFQSIKSSPIPFPELELEPEESSNIPNSPSAYKPTLDSSTKKKTDIDIFKAYDIRGIVEKSLTKDIVFDIGRAIGSEAHEKNIKSIVIGRDGRLSSPALTESLCKGIISTGINVLDIGLVPSPVVYFVTQHSEGKSGVVVTGSHNPAEYNGLKIIINGETLAGEKIQALKQRIIDENFHTSSLGSVEKNSMFINEYIGIISEDIHIARPMKIVVDCGNGAAGELAPILFRTLGCEVIELFCEIDGTFPNHHPDPSKPENLTDLITAVKHYQADIGIALDGDGDRLGVVDCQGKIIWPDRQMMLFAKNVLSSKPSSEIIYDVKCSRLLGEQIVKYGGTPVMWKTGHSLIKARLKETGAVLAGEMSGHIFFNDRWFGFDDALYAASRMIEILSIDSKNSAEVFSEFPDSINTPEITIELTDIENTIFMEHLFSVANFSDGKINKIDGMRVEFADGWGLIRASNTMPLLTLRFEADNTEALNRIKSQFKQLISQVKPDLQLPF